MEITGTLFYLMTNVFRVYILYRFFGLFLKQKASKRRLLCCYVSLFLINSAGYLFLASDMINLLTNMAGLLLAVLAGYKGSILKKIISVFASYGMAVLTEDLAWVLLVKVAQKDPGQIAEFGFFFATFLFFLLEAVIERTIKLRKEINVSPYKNIMLIAILLGSIFLSSVLIEGFYHAPILLIPALCILIAIDIATFYIYEKLLDDYVKLKEEETHQLQLAMYQNQLKLMQNANDAYKSMRHDMKQHLSMLTGYLQNGEKHKALDYISQINGGIGKGSKYIDTGNKDVDCIFNYITGEVIEIGGSVATDIKVPEEMPVDNFDLNVILSNLLLNACEAVSKCDKKVIHAAMRYDRGALKISVQNTYNGELEQKGDELLSTKQEKAGHGIGLWSVRKAVEKYGGVMEISHTEEIFKVDILLYI